MPSRLPRRLLANRSVRRLPFRRSRKDDGAIIRLIPFRMLLSLRCGDKTRSRKPCAVPGRDRKKKALPNAWWCAGTCGRSGPHLSFLLVRLGGFAADYFRGNPSALPAAGLSGARCSGFGEADARLITIGELDAGRLECTL